MKILKKAFEKIFTSVKYPEVLPTEHQHQIYKECTRVLEQVRY
jgi:hypothetical protein